MDYLRLKKTLIAAFDHFLSCHDMDELEEMMQAFEAGKSLVIGFPEPIHREDYYDDIKTDVLAVKTRHPKRITSRIKNKKPKTAAAITQQHIATVPVFMDLSALNGDKKRQVSEVLKSNHHNISLSDVMIKGHHGFGLAKIYKTTPIPKQENKNPLWMGTHHERISPVKGDMQKESIVGLLFSDKKQFDPP